MMAKKFFAFFQTEEQFLRFLNDYIEKHPNVLRRHDAEIRHHSRIFAFDLATMALGRMGFGEKRLMRYNDTLESVVKDYLPKWMEDSKCDEEMIYSRELFERELKQHCRRAYVPEEERY